MKIVQLNVWHFKYLNELITFLQKEQPDIVNMQEVSSGRFNYCSDSISHPFEVLKKELGMNGKFMPFSGLDNGDGTISDNGNGYLTKFRILDEGCFFEKTLPNYNIYKESDDLIQTVLFNQKDKYFNVFEEPKNYVWSVLEDQKGNIIRNLTTHFTVSYGCKETLQMINQTRSVLDYLNNVKDVPTIFSGDLNIHPKSSSVVKLSEKLDLVNKGVVNTLNKEIHPLFKNEVSKGLAVDYIFQKGFEVVDWSVPEITVSDHLPVIAELEIK